MDGPMMYPDSPFKSAFFTLVFFFCATCIFIPILLFIGVKPSVEIKPSEIPIEKEGKVSLLNAIKQVESNGNSEAVGDSGRSIGAYQISEGYFKDAQEFDESLRGYAYERVKDDKVAIEVIGAYWARYVTKKRLGHEPTDQDRARCHNGGPNGYKRNSTKAYWAKVKKVMEGGS